MAAKFSLFIGRKNNTLSYLKENSFEKLFQKINPYLYTSARKS